MLRPTAVQAALTTLIETPCVPADCALIVMSDSGTIYARADGQKDLPVASSSLLVEQKNDSQRQQLARQPGLHSLMGGNPRPIATATTAAPPVTSSPLPAMELAMGSDERAKVLAALACQSWTEESNRVKRLFPKLHGGHGGGPGSLSESGMMRSFSGSTGGGGSGTGLSKGLSRLRRVEQTGGHTPESASGLAASLQQHQRQGKEQDLEQQESVAAPVAVPGTLLSVGGSGQGVAPLLLEGELGALLVMPLHHQIATSTPSSPTLPPGSPPLLLVLSARPSPDMAAARSQAGSGASMLSQQQWNDLNDAAHAFASHVGPSLRKAFGRGEGVSGGGDVVGDAATLSDMESSVSLDGATTAAAGQEGHDNPVQ